MTAIMIPHLPTLDRAQEIVNGLRMDHPEASEDQIVGNAAIKLWLEASETERSEWRIAAEARERCLGVKRDPFVGNRYDPRD